MRALPASAVERCNNHCMLGELKGLPHPDRFKDSSSSTAGTSSVALAAFPGCVSQSAFLLHGQGSQRSCQHFTALPLPAAGGGVPEVLRMLPLPAFKLHTGEAIVLPHCGQGSKFMHLLQAQGIPGVCLPWLPADRGRNCCLLLNQCRLTKAQGATG